MGPQPVLYNALGAVAFVLTVVSLHQLGRKDRRAFLLFTGSCLLQSYVYWQLGQWFLLAQAAVLIAYNARNFVLWRQ